MKTLLPIFILLFALASCNETKEAKETKLPEISTKERLAKKPTKNGTYLCKINGKDWHYTKASGVLTINRKTGKQTAIITFKRQLKKGSESIQLYYNAENLTLRKASVQLKFPKKDGGKLHGFYNLDSLAIARQPESSMSGTIDLSNPSKVSGNAQVNKMHIGMGAKNELKNPEDDAIITISDLEFDNVGYSDLNKLFKK